MIRLSLWLPLELIIMCSSGEVAVGGTVKVAQQRFYVCVNVQFTFSTCEIYESACCLLKHCTTFCFSDKKSTFRALNRLYFWWEMKNGTQKAFHCLSVACSVSGRTVETKGDAEIFFPVPLLPVSLLWQASISKNGKYTHTHKSMQAVSCHLLSPNYSRLEPMLLSLILSVRVLWGNSDISVWCLPYVSRAQPGPIKLIFNVCPTLDGPSQGWHMISVW